MLTDKCSEFTISRTQVQLWYNRFKKGRKDVYDNARPGPSSTSTTDENIEAVKKISLRCAKYTVTKWHKNMIKSLRLMITLGSCSRYRIY